jgi:hypothetical protein
MRFCRGTTLNDFVLGPDKGLYISDTAHSKIHKLPTGASTVELFLKHRALRGIDGITFGDGMLYVNNAFSNNLHRIPVDAAGKTGQPVDSRMDQPVKGPDGMRSQWQPRPGTTAWTAERGACKAVGLFRCQIIARWVNTSRSGGREARRK